MGELSGKLSIGELATIFGAKKGIRGSPQQQSGFTTFPRDSAGKTFRPFHVLSTDKQVHTGATFRILPSTVTPSEEGVTIIALTSSRQDTPALQRPSQETQKAPNHATQPTVSSEHSLSPSVPIELTSGSTDGTAIYVHGSGESSEIAAVRDTTSRRREKLPESTPAVAAGSGKGNKPPNELPPASSAEDPGPDKNSKTSGAETLINKVYSFVVAAIGSGELKSGGLIDWTGVSADIGAKARTIARARKALIADGYVSTVRGVGTFVGKEPPADVKPTPPKRVPIKKRKIMNHVSARIASGELRPGMVIDWNDIATQTGIPVLSMGNSRRALVHEGLICTVRGVGTFVGKEPPADVKPIPPKRVPIQQRKIMNHVSARIASGELRPGMIIDWNDIATRTGAPLASMGKPRRALVREGLICTIRGVGTFVGKEPPADVKPTPPKRVPLQQRKIMNHVLARIASGELKPGMIIDWTGVNADIGAKTRTIARARKALIADGYVSTVRGVGTFVGKEPPTGVKAILSDKNE